MKKKTLEKTRSFTNNMRSSNAETFKADFQTPVPVARYMASLVPPHCKTVLEPTPGIGNIKNALQRAGFDVTAPDDYFLIPKTKRFDAVVYN